MTPQFTTPCYVRIEDADKRKEVCEKLDKLGYTPAFSFSKNRYPFIIAHDSQWDTISESTLSDVLAFICKYFTDCGTDTELFLALASMREDTDKGQYFISKGWRDGDGIPVEDRMTKCLCDTLEQWGVVNNSPNSYNRANGNPFGWERATAAEIVEHFNRQTNDTN